MTRSLLTLIAAAGFTAATSFALAQSPNDGPKYPNMESHKQFKDIRNLDHNNPSPRYAATGTTGTTQRASVSRKPRYVVHARHGAAGQHG
jgi:hypothetical protein